MMIPIGVSGFSEFSKLVAQKVMNILGNYIEASLNDDLEGAVTFADQMPDIPTSDPRAVEGLGEFIEVIDKVLAGTEAWKEWALRQQQIAQDFIEEQETT